MDNFTIYKRTLGFSLRRVFWDFMSIILLLALSTVGYVIAEQVSEDSGALGLIFGALVGVISLLIIGGAFTGVFYLILSANGEALAGLYHAVAEAAAESESQFGQLLQNPATVPVAIAALGGIIVWSMVHATFVKPFVLTGVLRNYMASGINDIPSELSFGQLDSISPKFRKLHDQL